MAAEAEDDVPPPPGPVRAAAARIAGGPPVELLVVATGLLHEAGRGPEKSLGELDLKGRLGLTPIAIRRGAQVFVNPAREERVAEGDELILIGRDEKLDQLR